MFDAIIYSNELLEWRIFFWIELALNGKLWIELLHYCLQFYTARSQSRVQNLTLKCIQMLEIKLESELTHKCPYIIPFNFFKIFLGKSKIENAGSLRYWIAHRVSGDGNKETIKSTFSNSVPREIWLERGRIYRAIFRICQSGSSSREELFPKQPFGHTKEETVMAVPWRMTQGQIFFSSSICTFLQDIEYWIWGNEYLFTVTGVKKTKWFLSCDWRSWVAGK